MKKTINANIGGVEFTLNEDAYASLERYLDRLKRYFRQTEGSEDIMDDIEVRIAEILQERLDKRKIVEMKDVEAVQETIGMPEDFETPEDDSQQRTRSSQSVYLGKQLFRNPDDKILGGVASGIGAYFSIDPVWIRLAFVIGTLFYGTTLLIYIIMWIVIPEAKTTTQRMQMRGEPVNIDNIKKNVQDEINDMGERVKNFANGAKDWSQSERTRDPIRGAMNALGNAIRVLAKAVGKLFIFLVLIVALTIIGSIIISMATGTAVMAFSIPFLNDYIFTADWQMWLVLIGSILVVLIPIAWIIIRLFFNKNMNRNSRSITNVSAITLWVIAIWMIIPVGLNIGFDFRVEDRVIQSNVLTTTTDTLSIRVDNKKGGYYDWNGYVNESSGKISLNTAHFDIMDDTLILSDIEIRTLSTTDTFYSVKTHFIARGSDHETAKERAAKINYHYELKDEELIFDPYYTLGGAPFRVQEVEVYVYVPEKKHTILSIR